MEILMSDISLYYTMTSPNLLKQSESEIIKYETNIRKT